MKRLLFTAVMATAFFFGTSAQTVINDDYSSPITGADGQGVSQSSDDEAESYSYGAVGFYSFDGFENWGIAYGGINPNGIGLDFAFLPILSEMDENPRQSKIGRASCRERV